MDSNGSSLRLEGIWTPGDEEDKKTTGSQHKGTPILMQEPATEFRK